MCFQNYDIDIFLSVLIYDVFQPAGVPSIAWTLQNVAALRAVRKKWRGTGISTGGRRVLRLRVRHFAERTRVGGKFLPETSVADPDPCVSGSPGSGSITLVRGMNPDPSIVKKK
jgi:hypothetical protein